MHICDISVMYISQDQVFGKVWNNLAVKDNTNEEEKKKSNTKLLVGHQDSTELQEVPQHYTKEQNNTAPTKAKLKWPSSTSIAFNPQVD